MAKMLALGERQLVDILMNGGVVVLPTDTLYGLVCRAIDIQAVNRLYATKHREHKPGTVIAATATQLSSIGITQTETASQFWPGPISVILPIDQPHQFITQSMPDVACRVVAGPATLVDLLVQTGPLLTTSANMPGEPPAATIAVAQDYFGDYVDAYVDEGDLTARLPSSLVRIEQGKPVVLRRGAGTISRKEQTNDTR